MTEAARQTSTIELPDFVSIDGPVALNAYQRAAHLTDKMPADDFLTPVLGAFGEVGGLVAALKKQRREGAAYPTYHAEILEELGDVLWYLAAIATRANLDLSALAGTGERSGDEKATFQSISASAGSIAVTEALVELASEAGALVGALHARNPMWQARVRSMLQQIALAATTAGIDLDRAARLNLEKVFGRWPLRHVYPPIGDDNLPLTEQLPRRFNIFIEEHTVNGKTYVLQKRNGVIVGDRLTDNKAKLDDYRFHDVFHIAYAVHLGWSPVLRSLFHIKRKSRPELDENEDGARAILIEEGIATFIFGRASERTLFKGLDRLDYDLLKIARNFVRGYEAERCAAWQWELAILDGFKVFRELAVHRRGWVVADLARHSLEFKLAGEFHNPGDDEYCPVS